MISQVSEKELQFDINFKSFKGSRGCPFVYQIHTSVDVPSQWTEEQSDQNNVYSKFVGATRYIKTTYAPPVLKLTLTTDKFIPVCYEY